MSLLELIETGKPLEIKRAIAVLMSIKGYSRSEISELLDVSIQFIDKWKSVYFKKGVEGLKLGYRGSQGYLSLEQRQNIIEYIQSRETISVDELRDYIKIKYNVKYNSLKSYTQLLHEARFSYKKTQKINPKKDNDKVEAKKKEIQEIINLHQDEIKNGSIIIWMQDESHQLWGDACGYAWGPCDERLPIPMTNFRERQTWYGAVNCYTGKFFIEDYEAGNTKNTIDFVEKLYQQAPNSQHIIIWDNASHHKSNEFRAYLKEKNAGLSDEKWKIKCIGFAPNAPEQNPVENIWLIGKNWVRKNFSDIKVFNDATQIFRDFLSGRIFCFNKLKSYMTL